MTGNDRPIRPDLIIDDVYLSRIRWTDHFNNQVEVISVIQLNKQHELVTIRTSEGKVMSLLGKIEEATKTPVDIIDSCDPEVEKEREMIGKYFPMTWMETTDWWWQRI